jgi:hypothetical protein
MTPDAALDLLKELSKRTGLSLVQVCEEYKRLLAVYMGVSKKDLTDEKLLAENNFKSPARRGSAANIDGRGPDER